MCYPVIDLTSTVRALHSSCSCPLSTPSVWPKFSSPKPPPCLAPECFPSQTTCNSSYRFATTSLALSASYLADWYLSCNNVNWLVTSCNEAHFCWNYLGKMMHIIIINMTPRFLTNKSLRPNNYVIHVQSRTKSSIRHGGIQNPRSLMSMVVTLLFRK